ncbi:hypothetical protein A9Q99_23440 [Gammaproteobacteria bacterium 45_16_T64]|nr:hypothetical protein A9Q99_23440 [Gammaproteobacteria bacterium 45_16_T64]
MMQRFVAPIILLLLFIPDCLLAKTAQAVDAITLGSQNNYLNIGKRVFVLEDINNRYDVSEIRSLPHNQFTQGQDESLNYGITQSTMWVKFSVLGNTKNDLNYLQIRNVFLDKIDLYVYQRGRLQKEFHTGDSRPGSQRPIKSNYFVFPIPLSTLHPADIYIRIIGDGTISIPLSLWKPQRFHEKHRLESIVMGGYFFSLTIMILYNLFFWASTRLPSYPFYLFFALSMLFLQSALRGYGIEFIWPDQFFFQNRAVPILGIVTNLFSILFARSFLETKRYLPKLDMLMLSVAMISIPLLPFFFFTSTATSTTALVIYSIMQCTLAFSSGLLSWRANNPLAKYFVIAWTTLLFGALSTVFVSIKVFPTNFFTEHLFLIGSVAELILFSFALAHRVSLIENKAKTTLHIANRELQRSNLIKDEFLAAISHELRTPMNGVQGALTLINESEKNEDISEYINIAERSAEHMIELISAVLSYSESVSGNLVLKEQHFHLSTLLEPCIREFSMQCKEKALSFNPIIDSACEENFEGDADKIKIITYQLLSNAVKYTESGIIEFHLHLPNKKSNSLHMTIQDSGDGISDEQQAYILKGIKKPNANYHQLNHGIGIGIKLCRFLINMMGGKFSLKSTLGEGTRIDVEIPIQPFQSISPQDRISTPLAIGVTTPGRAFDPTTKSILIVEDNKVNQMVLKGILRKMGYKISLAENGKIAIGQLESQDFDLVFMDLQMPVMDGFEATKYIRNTESTYKNVPIIAITANAMSTDEAKCLAIGMNAYIQKPVRKSILVEKLNTVFPVMN